MTSGGIGVSRVWLGSLPALRSVSTMSTLRREYCYDEHRLNRSRSRQQWPAERQTAWNTTVQIEQRRSLSSSFASFGIAPARRIHVPSVPADDYAQLQDSQAKTSTHTVILYQKVILSDCRLRTALSSSACSPNESHALQSLLSTRFGTTLTCNPPKIPDSDATLAMRNKANNQLNSKRTRGLLSVCVCEFSPSERADSLPI